jgi:hypothetical protein
MCFLLCIREVLGWKLGPETGCPSPQIRNSSVYLIQQNIYIYIYIYIYVCVCVCVCVSSFLPEGEGRSVLPNVVINIFKRFLKNRRWIKFETSKEVEHNKSVEYRDCIKIRLFSNHVPFSISGNWTVAFRLFIWGGSKAVNMYCFISPPVMSFWHIWPLTA